MKDAPYQRQLVLSAEFDDVDLFCSTVRDWDLDFAPLSKRIQSGRIAQVSQSGLGNFLLGRLQFSVPLEQRGAAPAGFYTFVSIENSLKRLWWRGIEADCDEILVYRPGSDVSCTSGIDFSVHVISVPEEMCLRILSDLRVDRVSLEKLPDNFSVSPGVAQSLRQSMRAVSSPLGSPSRSQVRGLAEKLVRQWAVSVDDLPTSRPRMRRRDQAVRDSLDYLDRDDWFTATPGDLCAHCRVSERTLQYAFRERFGVTPGAFLKARRLAAVRFALKQDGAGHGSVSQIAGEYEFWHTGQFASDYRSLFGELPKETLKHR